MMQGFLKSTPPLPRPKLGAGKKEFVGLEQPVRLPQPHTPMPENKELKMSTDFE